MKKIAEYLGTEVAVFLQDERFKGWKVERTEENELEPPVVYYVFPEGGLALECDADERISTIFLRSKDGHTFDDKLISPDLSLIWNRKQVLQHLVPWFRLHHLLSPLLGYCWYLHLRYSQLYLSRYLPPLYHPRMPTQLFVLNYRFVRLCLKQK